MNLPALGVGLTYFPGLEATLERNAAFIDVLEVEPQSLWYRARSPHQSFGVNQAALDWLVAYDRPKLVHSVAAPAGGTRPPQAVQLNLLRDFVAGLGSPWMSEHLSFNRIGRREGESQTGFLLPPRQTWPGVAAAVASIRALQATMPVPLAVETGVNYLKPRRDELPDGEFVAAVVETADCGILLDLHNLWTNQRNGRQAVVEFLETLPLNRVWEVHLAGGHEHQGYWLDAHSGPVPSELMELAAQIVPRLPNLRAIIFELYPAYLSAVEAEFFRDQMKQIRRLWDRRGTTGRSGRVWRHRRVMAAADSPSPEEWEDTLGALVLGRKVDTPLSRDLSADPGLEIVRYLVGEFRASMITRTLRLTIRLLLLMLGEKGLRLLWRQFWDECSPEPFASDEAEKFAEYLDRVAVTEVPYLADVLGFERALIGTLLDGRERPVRFRWDPLPLLRSLGAGRLPGVINQGDFEVVVTPDAQAFSATA